MQRTFILLITMHLALVTFTFAQVDTAWVRRYNGPVNDLDRARAIAIDDSGNVYVTGYSYGPGTNIYDYATIKYNASGSEKWVARYDGPGNTLDYASAITVDGSGNVYVTGMSGYSYDYDYATIKYNALGVEEWIARYNVLGNSEASAIAVDDSGNVYVTGKSYDSSSSYDYATIKYNALGVEQWVQRYNGPGNNLDYASAIAVDDSGNVYVTGRSYNYYSLTYSDYATIKYNASGVEQWVARYNGPANDWDEATAIAVDGTGNVYVCGRSVDSYTYYDYATIKYNASGVEQWVARYNGPVNGWDGAYAIAIDDSGNVYVTGEIHGSGTSSDYATIKYVQAPGISESQISNPLDFKIAVTNPFYSQTLLSYSLPTEEKVFLQIFDIHGRLVKNLVAKKEKPGVHRVGWDGRDKEGRLVPEGMYFFSLKTSRFNATQKAILLR